MPVQDGGRVRGGSPKCNPSVYRVKGGLVACCEKCGYVRAVFFCGDGSKFVPLWIKDARREHDGGRFSLI